MGEYLTAASGGNGGLGSREPLVTTFFSSDQHLTLLLLREAPLTVLLIR